MKLSADRLAAKTWIYPLNKPKRDYQYNIVKKCLYENTLVALPTGLGKTFIAGVVMLNCTSTVSSYPVTTDTTPDYNWFPQGKVVFVAPTKPLVAQQIDACHKTCGIPGSAAAELTGNVTKDRRIAAVCSCLICMRMSDCALVEGQTRFLRHASNILERPYQPSC